MAGTQPKPPQYYPVHPTNMPVSPDRLNAHQRLATDGIKDLNTALQALVAKLQVGSIPVSVVAGGTSTVSVVWPNAYEDLSYAGIASVEGASLQVVNVLRSKATLAVTVLNTDGANPHTGTVMAIGYHF